MTELHGFSALLIGLAGGIHCIGMCGGIAAAFTLGIPANAPQWPYLVAYNIGRIASYTLAGALTGYLGTLFSRQISYGTALLSLFSGIMLFFLALYITGWWHGLAKLEQLGGKLWQKISPLSKALLPFRSPISALPYGIIWGWLPCGLVYSTLSWSMASGSAIDGAKVMFWFGVGTLPALLVTGALGNRVKQLLNRTFIRTIVGLFLIVFSWALIWRTVLLFNLH